jgi:hypothetical protein
VHGPQGGPEGDHVRPGRLRVGSEQRSRQRPLDGQVLEHDHREVAVAAEQRRDRGAGHRRQMLEPRPFDRDPVGGRTPPPAGAVPRALDHRPAPVGGGHPHDVRSVGQRLGCHQCDRCAPGVAQEALDTGPDVGA